MDDQPSNVKSNVNFYRKPGNQTASVMCNEEYQQQNQEGRPEIAPLHFSGSLAKTVLNSLSANIAILDECGVILETNQAWRNYATENKMEGFRRGGIIVMGTDGVWEARNEKGQMFGRTAIYDVIRDNSAAGAGDIMEAILSRIKNFRKTEQPEDDVTLVVVKKL